MARAQTKKRWYYVAVLRKDHISLVTKVEYYPHKVAEWKDSEKPIDFKRDYAEQLALGLCVNGYHAYVLMSQWELENQLYIVKESEEENNETI